MNEVPTPPTEPLSTAQRLAGIELQLIRLNAQIRTIARWTRFREGFGLVMRIAALAIGLYVAIAATQFLRTLQDRPFFGQGSLEQIQEQLRSISGFDGLMPPSQ